MKKVTAMRIKGQEELDCLRDIETRHAAIRQELQMRIKNSVLGYAYELLRGEVEALCGLPFSHKSDDQMRRGGSEAGSLLVEGQRICIKKPRVRDGNNEHHLDTYRALHDYDILSEDVGRLLLQGISTRKYDKVITKYTNGLGLPKSSVSRAFIRVSQKSLDDINGRDLSNMIFIGLFLDGVEFNGILLLVALGVTENGEKMMLGLKEGGSENSEVCKDLLEAIISRNFKTKGQILVTIDGAKPLRKAVGMVFGEKAFVQRCQEHKIRNVQSYLPQSKCAEVRRRMMAAYNMNSYAEAKEALNATTTWLRNMNEEAARSIEEGLEETLTVHKLELPLSLRKTFRTTNPIESIFSTLKENVRRVKNWRSGRNQASRWTASVLLAVESGMRRIKGYSALPVLVSKLSDKTLALSERYA